MDHYTEFFEDRTYQISPEDENYREELIAVAASFRNFDEALEDFLQMRAGRSSAVAAGDSVQLVSDLAGDSAAPLPEAVGGRPELTDADAKTAYIRNLFAEAGIPAPRNIKRWFTEHRRIERPTAISLCFALGLDLDEAQSFLRNVCLQRGLDCHNPEELIAYFALRHGLSFTEMKQAADSLPDIRFDQMKFTGDILYTSSIIREAERFSELSQLVDYITQNIDQFRYNNATAYRTIRRLWERISAEDGLVCAERRMEAETERQTVSMGGGSGQQLSGYAGLKIDRADGSRKAKGLSVWDILLHICGLNKEEAAKEGTDRSLKHILKNNALLHPLAEDSFPDRDGITKILNGNHVSNERVRKILILLVFYQYWAERAIERGHYGSSGDDGERCLAVMNNYLTDAGYPTLYAGNPYDWIFLYAMTSDWPLSVFRGFMEEIAKAPASENPK